MTRSASTHRPGIFISHCCKDKSPLDRDARSVRIRAARRIRDSIVKRLSHHFDVWLDRDRLEPGVEWHPELFRQLGYCDAAVILISQDTLASPWVRTEATILSGRYWRSQEPHRGPRIVPVLLEDINDARLAEFGFEPFRLLDFQAIGPCDSDEEYATSVAAAFADLTLAPADHAMRYWIKTLVHHLESAPLVGLEAAAEVLQIHPSDFADEQRIVRLAHTLLHTELDVAHNALLCVVDDLSMEAWERIVQLVTPVWVDLRAAHALLEASIRPERPAVLVIEGTEDQVVGEHYVARATCCSPRHRPISNVAALGEAAVDQALESYDNVIRRELHLDSLTDSRSIGERLRRAGRVPYVLVRRDGLTDSDFAELLQRLTSRYPDLLFILLPGRDAPAAQMNGSVSFQLVEPELSPERLESAMWNVRMLQTTKTPHRQEVNSS
jgi:hypothetical protein